MERPAMKKIALSAKDANRTRTLNKERRTKEGKKEEKKEEKKERDGQGKER